MRLALSSCVPVSLRLQPEFSEPSDRVSLGLLAIGSPREERAAGKNSLVFLSYLTCISLPVGQNSLLGERPGTSCRAVSG